MTNFVETALDIGLQHPLRRYLSREAIEALRPCIGS